MVTLQELKDWLGITVDTHDARLQALLERTIDFVQREVGWYFGPPRQVTEVLDGPGGGVLFLRQPPVLAHPVTFSTRSAFPEDWEDIEATDYELDGRRVLHVSLWDAGTRNFRVTYHEGFEDPPGDAVQQVLNLAQAAWMGRTLNPEMKSERIGDYSYTRADLEKSASRVPGWDSFVNKWRRGRI